MTDPTLHDRFLALVDEHKRLIYKVANVYARDDTDRVDLVQEILAQAWCAFPRYDPRQPFPTWMYRVALNVAISAFRSERRRTRTIIAGDEVLLHLSADDAPAADERLAEMYACIARLRPLERAIVLLHLDGQQYRAIGDILGLSATNVGTRLARIRLQLRRDMTTVTTVVRPTHFAPHGTA